MFALQVGDPLADLELAQEVCRETAHFDPCLVCLVLVVVAGRRWRDWGCCYLCPMREMVAV